MLVQLSYFLEQLKVWFSLSKCILWGKVGSSVQIKYKPEKKVKEGSAELSGELGSVWFFSPELFEYINLPFFAEEVATSAGGVFPRRCININVDVYLIKLHVLQKPSTSFPPHWLVSESGYSLPEHRF